MGHVGQIDPGLAKTLMSFEEVVVQIRALEKNTSLGEVALKEKIGSLTYKGATFEDLALTYVLPGHPDVELIDGGADMEVTPFNLENYLQAVVNFTMDGGISRQMEAFRAGFDNVFPSQSLDPFKLSEIESIFCGSTSKGKWTVEELSAATKTDHGYSFSSDAVKYLWEIMSELDRKEQREVVAFFTGCPNLPIGGWANLKPRFTVVKKPGTSEVPSDDLLPSVMTCQNYLKLPNYSSKEIMRKKLMLAVKEGAGSFHLS